MKKLLSKQQTLQRHWVGDGFPVRTIFSYHDIAQEMSPFLLMDFAGPENFNPSKHRRGVGEHPHRGFETVTIVYDGEVEHRDSAGGGGRIGPGDVQWMTAASGLVHEEKHGKDFAEKGGRFQMVQLWVNLPAKDKMSKPRYQGIKNQDIPKVSLPNDGGYVRVIAGDYKDHSKDHHGPAHTFTPINLWDIRLNAGHRCTFVVPEGHTASVFVLNGQISLGGDETFGEAELAILEPKGDRFELVASQDSQLLFLGGAPIHEPVVGYGPFVMNSIEEIQKAFVDFNSGKMGNLQIEGSE